MAERTLCKKRNSKEYMTILSLTTEYLLKYSVMLVVVGGTFYLCSLLQPVGAVKCDSLLQEAGLALHRNDVLTARSHLSRAWKAGVPTGEVRRVLSEHFTRVRHDYHTNPTFNSTLVAASLSHIMGEHTTALKYYLEADGFTHGDWNIPYRIAEILSSENRSLEAAETYNKSALLRPARAKTWLRSAISFKSAGIWAKAAEQGWRAVRANKSWYKPYVFLHSLQEVMPEREDLNGVLQEGMYI